MKFLFLASVFASDSDEGSGISIVHTCTGDETIQSSAIVDCSADSMRVVIDKCAFDNMGNVPVDEAKLGGATYDISECGGVYSDDENTFTFESSLGSCGTQMDKDDTHMRFVPCTLQWFQPR